MIDDLKTVGVSTYENIKRDIIFGNLTPLNQLKIQIPNGMVNCCLLITN